MNSPILSIEELKDLMSQDVDLHILDASIAFQIPGEMEKITGKHIPGARRFDYDTVFCDSTSSLPHMMPPEEDFNRKAQLLGINNDSVIVCYDNAGTFASPRAWWMFKAMGHKQVFVLNGGLPAWIAAAGETTSSYKTIEKLGDFNGELHSEYFVDSDSVLRHTSRQSAYILDARSQQRFDGKVPEPRKGIRSGHIPTSFCLPYTQLLEHGHLKSLSGLKKEFNALGCELINKPIIFSCGSGVTACILLLAAQLIGYSSLTIYDGSWTEWGASSLPIE